MSLAFKVMVLGSCWIAKSVQIASLLELSVRPEHATLHLLQSPVSAWERPAEWPQHLGTFLVHEISRKDVLGFCLSVTLRSSLFWGITAATFARNRNETVKRGFAWLDDDIECVYVPVPDTVHCVRRSLCCIRTQDIREMWHTFAEFSDIFLNPVETLFRFPILSVLPVLMQQPPIFYGPSLPLLISSNQRVIKYCQFHFFKYFVLFFFHLQFHIALARTSVFSQWQWLCFG